MANIFKGWVAPHTGLPSLYAAGFDGAIGATDSTGYRYLGDVSITGTVMSDAGAPAGETVIYTVDTVGIPDVTLTRTGGGHQLITDRWGRGGARFRQVGDDELTYDPRVALAENSTGFPSVRYALTPESPTGTLECLTLLEDTLALRALVASRSPLWLIHNHGLCQIQGCDIMGTRLVQPTSFREQRTGRDDHAEREWTIHYRVLDASRFDHGVPVVTWGEWETWGLTHSPAGWQNWSEIQTAQKVGGMP